MKQYILISVMVLMLHSSKSYAWVFYPLNNSAMSFRYHQFVSIICSDTNEVEWKIDSTDQATNHVKEIKPNEKILEIEKAIPHDTGVYINACPRKTPMYSKGSLSPSMVSVLKRVLYVLRF